MSLMDTACDLFSTGVDCQKYLGKPKYWEKVATSDKIIGISQLLGARAPSAPQIRPISLGQAYPKNVHYNHV